MLAYATLAGRQLRAFEEKWLGVSPAVGEEMLRAPDFSVVWDFNSTVTVIQKMNTLPFRPRHLLPLIVAALLPFLPVAAIKTPVKDILLQMWKLVK